MTASITDRINSLNIELNNSTVVSVGRILQFKQEEMAQGRKHCTDQSCASQSSRRLSQPHHRSYTSYTFDKQQGHHKTSVSALDFRVNYEFEINKKKINEMSVFGKQKSYDTLKL